MGETTRSEDYSSSYYNDAHLGGYGDYSWESDEWREFFRRVADRLIGIVNPATVLDVGCAKGLLVQALREKNVDASGIDISEHAVATAHEDVREHLRVGSATAPLPGRYSLITCVEVLEHMAPDQAQDAIDRMCEATDRVFFSSSPSDHREPTHINTKPTAQWAAAFAERGFFRRTDVDVSFLTPWAVLFERADLTLHDLAHRYESQYTELNTELVEKRAALLDSYREVSRLQEDRGPEITAEVIEEHAALVKQWEAEVLEARHQLLTMRDHVVGTEAEVARLTQDNTTLRAELTRTRKQVRNLRNRIATVRERANRLQRRVNALAAELESVRTRPSVARRAARKMLGR